MTLPPYTPTAELFNTDRAKFNKTAQEYTKKVRITMTGMLVDIDADALYPSHYLASSHSVRLCMSQNDPHFDPRSPPPTVNVSARKQCFTTLAGAQSALDIDHPHVIRESKSFDPLGLCSGQGTMWCVVEILMSNATCGSEAGRRTEHAYLSFMRGLGDPSLYTLTLLLAILNTATKWHRLGWDGAASSWTAA